MYRSLDIAAYIVELSKETGEPITNMKLQKLIYYVYAWYAVEKGEKLFDEPIYAWKYGPVIEAVYDAYKEFGADVIKEVKGSEPKRLDDFTKSLIDDVFNIYGSKSAIDLVNLTHSEAPWRDTFNPRNQKTEITYDKIVSYYTSRRGM